VAPALARVHAIPGETIEPEGEVQPAPQMALLREKFGVETIKEYGEVIQVAQWVAREDRQNIELGVPLREKGFQAMLAEFRATHEAEYNEAKQFEAEADAHVAEQNSVKAESHPQ